MSSLEFESPKAFRTLGLIACIATWFVFGDVAFFRAVGILFIADGLSTILSKKMPVGIEGFKPKFYIIGNWALLFGVASLCIGSLIILFAKEVSIIL